MKVRLRFEFRSPRTTELAPLCCCIWVLSFLVSTVLNSQPADPVVVLLPHFAPPTTASLVGAHLAAFSARVPRPGRRGCSVLTEGELSAIVNRSALEHGVDGRMLGAIISVESGGNPCAVSPKGASGLMQLMPSTARHFGVRNAFDADASVAGGAKYLRWLLERYNNNLTLALAAYNAGPGNVDQVGGIPPFRETRQYVKKVLGRLPVSP